MQDFWFGLLTGFKMIENINFNIENALLKAGKERLQICGIAQYYSFEKGSALFVLDDEENKMFVPDDAFDVQICHILQGGTAIENTFGIWRHRIDCVCIGGDISILQILLNLLYKVGAKPTSYDLNAVNVLRNYVRYSTDNTELSAFVIRYEIVTDEDIYQRDKPCDSCE